MASNLSISTIFLNCPGTWANKLTGVLQVKIIEKRHLKLMSLCSEMKLMSKQDWTTTFKPANSLTMCPGLRYIIIHVLEIL